MRSASSSSAAWGEKSVGDSAARVKAARSSTGQGRAACSTAFRRNSAWIPAEAGTTSAVQQHQPRFGVFDDPAEGFCGSRGIQEHGHAARRMDCKVGGGKLRRVRPAEHDALAARADGAGDPGRGRGDHAGERAVGDIAVAAAESSFFRPGVGMREQRLDQRRRGRHPRPLAQRARGVKRVRPHVFWQRLHAPLRRCPARQSHPCPT